MNQFLKLFNFLYYKDSLKKPKDTLNKLKNFYKNFKYENIKNNDVYISKEKFDIIKKSFKKMILSYPESFEIVKYFLEADLVYISKKINEKEIEKDSPILICVEKDDLNKIKEMFNHHKKLGIKQFVFIDNGSTDGTIEFLRKQDNVDIIFAKTKYYTLAREAWINRVLCHYGYNKWYLVVDSDEMYNYINSEKINITEHIKRLERKGIKRELAFMLDMYSKEGIFENTNNFIKDYNYFDTNTYVIQQFNKFIKISGGPRKRNFKESGKNRSFMLGKYPLFMFEKTDVQSNSHFMFPFYKNIDIDCTAVLMHYKFIGDDIEKYKKRIKEKNYYNNSSDYKVYIDNYEKKNFICFFYENSKKYEDSLSLKDISILKEI